MSDVLLERLQQKLSESFAEPWGKFVLRCELNAETRFDAAAGGLIGGVTFFLTDVQGGDRVVHEAEISGLDSAEAVDDWLAEVLSALLAEHPRWQRQSAEAR